jgi:hypothetical protein
MSASSPEGPGSIVGFEVVDRARGFKRALGVGDPARSRRIDVKGFRKWLITPFRDMMRAVRYGNFVMNALLEKAFAEIARLPEPAQETIASLILDEIQAERGWDERFANSQDQLGELVRLARGEAARGDVRPYGPADRPAK